MESSRNGRAPHVGPKRDLPKLTEQDLGHLRSYEEKLQVVRDRTVQVARGMAPGLYVHGAGGVGKSFVVEQTLRAEGASFKLSNSRMTGRGLFDVLERNPDAIHLLEDLEKLFLDRAAMGVIRSACGGQRADGDRGPQERVVTWATWTDRAGCQSRQPRFLFTGGIVFTANSPPPALPEWDAIRTRIHVLQLSPIDAEVRAKMRELARRGYEHDGRTMTPEECVTVCEFVIEQSLAKSQPLNLRMLYSGWHDYLLSRDGDAGVHWKDLIRSSIVERPTWFREPVQVADFAEEVRIAAEIAAETDDREERVRRWTQRTHKSRRTFYRRLRG
jgi:hypothetical protein